MRAVSCKKPFCRYYTVLSDEKLAYAIALALNTCSVGAVLNWGLDEGAHMTEKSGIRITQCQSKRIDASVTQEPHSLQTICELSPHPFS